jgi:hypothetical protein
VCKKTRASNWLTGFDVPSLVWDILQGSQTQRVHDSEPLLFEMIANFQGTQNQYKICKASNKDTYLILDSQLF